MADKEAGAGVESHGEKGFRTPGLRSVQTTTLFRAVNPELFIKPVRLTHARTHTHTEPQANELLLTLEREPALLL